MLSTNRINQIEIKTDSRTVSQNAERVKLEECQKNSKKEIVEAATNLIAIIDSDITLLNTKVIPLADAYNSASSIQNMLLTYSVELNASVTAFKMNYKNGENFSSEQREELVVAMEMIDAQIDKLKAAHVAYSQAEQLFTRLSSQHAERQFHALQLQLKQIHKKITEIKTKKSFGRTDEAAQQMKDKLLAASDKQANILSAHAIEHTSSIRNNRLDEVTKNEGHVIRFTVLAQINAKENFTDSHFVQMIKKELAAEKAEANQLRTTASNIYRLHTPKQSQSATFTPSVTTNTQRPGASTN